MKKILISNPRYGSTFVTQIFHRYCEQNQKAIRAIHYGYRNELLLVNEKCSEDKFPLNDRIDMIERYRSEGIELLYQLHSHSLFYDYKDGIVLDWFKEFYKDSEIYILRRKDLWHALLSLIVHHSSDEMPNKKWHMKDENDIKELRNWYSYHRTKNIDLLIQSFCRGMAYLTICEQELETQTLWLEDIDLSFLNVKTEVDIKPYNLNYEEFFNESELEYIRTRLHGYKASFHF